MKILVLNAGSSSFKLAIYEFTTSLPSEAHTPLWNGELQWENSSEAHLKASLSNGIFVEKTLHLSKPIDGMQTLLQTAFQGNTKCLNSLADIDIVGHRVVHGGDIFHQPVRISNSVKEAIRKLFALAPLHNPYNLQGIELIEKLLPSIPQIAVFDTAFHHSLSQAASTYAGPYAWREQGIKRYGFHGISHQYCSTRCAAMLKRDIASLNMICCHLGNGCSLAAIQQGQSIDTTMGFTPLDGLMMGTRCGSLDPGILLFLQLEKKISAKELSHTLNHESGLKGISGSTSDMREILRLSNHGNARAKLAYDMYIHTLKRNIGAMAAVLGRLDALIFTAGIGENAWLVRQDACTALTQLGLALDTQKNKQTHSDAIISTRNSGIKVLVIHTEEDWSIACACWHLAKKH